MNWIAIIGIAFGLAMDAFAVSLAASAALRVVSPRQYFRLSFHFGLFQFLMPVIGWGWAPPWRATCPRSTWGPSPCAAAVGGKMIRESFGGDETARYLRPHPGLVAGGAVAGPRRRAGRGSASPCWAWVCSTPAWHRRGGRRHATLAGMRFGGALGARFGRWMELAGGLSVAGHRIDDPARARRVRNRLRVPAPSSRTTRRRAWLQPAGRRASPPAFISVPNGCRMPA